MLILRRNRPELWDIQDMFGDARSEALAVVDALEKLGSVEYTDSLANRSTCDGLDKTLMTNRITTVNSS